MVATQQQGVTSQQEKHEKTAGLLLAFGGRSAAAPVGDWAQLMRLLETQMDGHPVQVSLSVHPPVAKEEESPNAFRREGDMWTLRFAGRTVYVRDSKGLRYLAHAIAHPEKWLRVTEVFAAVSGCREAAIEGSSGEQLDRQAMNAYRDRIRELHGDLDEAREFHDYGLQERLQMEMDALAEQVISASGLGGRCRERSDADRHRVSVTVAIHRAIRNLEDTHPELARHLTTSVQTGRFLTYMPESPVEWSF